MSRGNARQKIVRDDLDCERLLVCLKRSVERYGWRVVIGGHPPQSRMRQCVAELRALPRLPIMVQMVYADDPHFTKTVVGRTLGWMAPDDPFYQDRRGADLGVDGPR